MTKDLTIWGRAFSLDVQFDYYDEPIPAEMIEAANALTDAPECIEEVYQILVQYCLENDGDEIRAMSRTDGVDNIFRYVMPQYLYVLEPEVERGAIHRVALMCDYRFDPEEGLAIVFENERYKKILPQSSVA